MQINIITSVNNAHQATGVVVVIDVFRAFSTQTYAFANGAEAIIPVLTLDEAYQLKHTNPEYILMGERGGLKPEGFDYGNSPTEILGVDFSGKTIIHTTSNGTKGMINAVKAEEILTGSFTNAKAIINYIKNNNFEEISLISTSPEDDQVNEDILLAQYIKDCLEDKDINEEQIKQQARSTAAHSFLLGEIGVPSTDIDLCLDFNRFNFVIKGSNQDNQIILRKISNIN